MRVALLKITIVFSLVLLFLAYQPGFCQEKEISSYPNRAITFISSNPAGTTGDLAPRLICKEAEKFLGQPIVVVNKPGASQALGTAALATAKPDGYTIGHTGHPGMFFAPHIEKVPYHPVRDLRQIMQYGTMNIAVTLKSDSPFKSLQDIVVYAQKNPKKLTYGSAGTGTLGHVAMEQIAKKERVQFTHIPFKGATETVAALLGGHILVGTGDFNPSLIEAGQIKIAFLISENPSEFYPKVPIMKDLGYDISAPLVLNVAGPKLLPDEIVKKLDDAFRKAMAEPAFIKGMKEFRLNVAYRGSKEANEYAAKNYELFGRILKDMELAK